MHAASSPTRWMWGFRMVVWTGLLFLDHTGEFKSKVKGLKSKIHKTTRETSTRTGSPLTVFKVKAVEVKAFHQVPQSLGLERRHGWVAHFPVGGGGEASKIRAWFRGRTGRCPSYLRVAFKVSVADCFDELLRDFNDVLLPHWQTEKGH